MRWGTASYSSIPAATDTFRLSTAPSDGRLTIDGQDLAKLTPAEQTWAKPLIQIWNVQNAGLHLVLGQAAAARDAIEHALAATVLLPGCT